MQYRLGYCFGHNPADHPCKGLPDGLHCWHPEPDLPPHVLPTEPPPDLLLDLQRTAVEPDLLLDLAHHPLVLGRLLLEVLLDIDHHRLHLVSHDRLLPLPEPALQEPLHLRLDAPPDLSLDAVLLSPDLVLDPLPQQELVSDRSEVELLDPGRQVFLNLPDIGWRPCLLSSCHYSSLKEGRHFSKISARNPRGISTLRMPKTAYSGAWKKSHPMARVILAARLNEQTPRMLPEEPDWAGDCQRPATVG